MNARQVMEAVMAGKKVDYFYSCGVEGEYSPLSFSEKLGLIDCTGNHDHDITPDCTYKIVVEPLECWIRVIDNKVVSTHYSRDTALISKDEFGGSIKRMVEAMD